MYPLESCRDALQADLATSGRIKPNAIGGTAELALRYSIISTFTAEPKHNSVITTGLPAGGLLEHGQRCGCTCRGRRTGCGTEGRQDQSTPPPSRRRRRTLQGLRADRQQPTPQRPQFLPSFCGPDGAADGLCRSTPRQADDSTTQPSWSRLTRQSDARDSMSSSICQCPTKPGPGVKIWAV